MESVRLHPRPWTWLALSAVAVPSSDASLQQQHFRFAVFPPVCCWSLLQHAPEQQQAFFPQAMPRQNSLRCPSGQTHWQGELPANRVENAVSQT